MNRKFQTRLVFFFMVFSSLVLESNFVWLSATQSASQYIASISWSSSEDIIAFSVATDNEEPCYSDLDLYAIRLINATTGNQTGALKENNYCPINTVDFSPNGDKLASVSRDGIFQIWDMNLDQLQVSMQIFNERDSVQWSPNGERLAISYASSVGIYPDNISNEAPNAISGFVGPPLIPTINDAVWGPDSNLVAIGSTDNIVRIWNSTTNTTPLVFQSHNSIVTSLAWNSSTNRIASADEAGTILIWNPLYGSVIHLLQGHTGEITKVVWRPDGQYLASASLDGTVRTWDAQTGTQVGMSQLTGGVYALDWSPDGSQIAYGGLFDPQNPAPIIATPLGVTPPPTDVTILRNLLANSSCQNPLDTAFQPAPSSYISNITWNPNGDVIAYSVAANSEEGCAGDLNLHAIRLVNSTNGTIVTEFKENYCSVNAVDYNMAGNQLISVSRDGFIYVWSLTTNQLEYGSQIFGEIEDIQWSPDGTKLFTADITGVDVYASNDVSGPTSGFSVPPEVRPATVATWSPNSSSIAVGSSDGLIRIWNNDTDRVTRVFEGHDSSISALNWNIQTNYIASGEENPTIMIWNPTNGVIMHTLQDHTDEITQVKWRPDGQYLASASLDGTVRIWDTQTGTQVGMSQLTGGVYALDWSPDGSQIAYGGIFDPQNPNPIIATPPGITPTPTDAAILRNLLANSRCQNPCFMGIEVDVTTRTQAQAIFGAEGIQLSFDGSSLVDSTFWYWIPDNAQPFINSGGTQYEAVLTFHNDVVVQITLPLDSPISNVLETFGNPTMVRASSGSSSNSPSNATYFLVYNNQRLVFSVSPQTSTNRVTNVFLVSGITTRNMLQMPIGENVAQPCANYGTPPCIAPTALPPTATFTPTPTSTP